MCVCFCKSCSTMLNELCSLTMHSWCVLIRDHLTCIYDAGCITCICENCNNSFFILRVLPVIYIHIYIYIHQWMWFFWMQYHQDVHLWYWLTAVWYLFMHSFFYSLDNHLDYLWAQHLLNCWPFFDEPLYSAGLLSDNMCRRGHELIHSLSLLLPRLLEERYRRLGDAGPKFVSIRSMDF